jgi:phosphoenolpyruvate---glycerone phosphotransferase subunit DhaL
MTKEILQKQDVIAALQTLAENMFAAKDELTQLDSAIGDGDLGVTMTLGFRAILEALKDTDNLDIQGVLSKCSLAFGENAASTFGALISTMLGRSGRVVKGLEQIGVKEGAAMLKAAADGVKQRGKAELGDKTVLDAMIPASNAYDQALEVGGSMAQCMAAALQAAKEGAESTVAMRSNAGRSGWLGDRTVGFKDPGAAAFVMILESLNGFVNQN